MSPSTLPLFSVITVCRNARETIAATLESVRTQRVGEGVLEHWVIDGDSDDGTMEIVRGFPEVRWLSEADKGIADAFNKGMRLARGRYVLYLNADDYFHDALVVADAARFLEKRGWPVWMVGDIATAQSGSPERLLPRLPISCWSMMFYCRAPHPAVFLHRETLVGMDGFRTELRVAMDYDLWQRMCARGYKPVHFPRLVSVFSTAGISSMESADQQAERRAIQGRFRDTRFKRLVGAAYDWLKKR